MNLLQINGRTIAELDRGAADTLLQLLASRGPGLIYQPIQVAIEPPRYDSTGDFVLKPRPSLAVVDVQLIFEGGKLPWERTQ